MLTRTVKSACCAAASILAATALAACGDEAPPTPVRGLGGGSGAASAPAAPAAAAGTSAGTAARAAAPTRPTLEITDRDMQVGRDPFVTKPPVVDVINTSANIVLQNTPIEHLHLVAVITSVDRPYAMVLDERGVGTIIRPGELVGQPDVRPGVNQGAPRRVPWRVQTIRPARVRSDSAGAQIIEDPASVSFVLDDPAMASFPGAEKRLELRTLNYQQQPVTTEDRVSSQPNTLPALPGALPPPGTRLPYQGPAPRTSTTTQQFPAAPGEPARIIQTTTTTTQTSPPPTVNVVVQPEAQPAAPARGTNQATNPAALPQPGGTVTAPTAQQLFQPPPVVVY